MSSSSRAPFEGIRVIDATHVLAGPFGAYQLGLLGADVIKVEGPECRDVARGRGPDARLNAAGLGINFLVQASNKRSVVIDLSTGEGRALFLDLVATADVVVENFRAGAFEALGLGASDLLARNPRLICCSITGFGRNGGRESVNAYDNVIQAASGLMSQTRAPDGTPLKSGASFVDYASGFAAAFAIAAALYQRRDSGVGQIIECSMHETALALMAPEASAALYGGPASHHAKEAGLGCYRTADGLVMLGAFNARQNRRLWDFLGRPDFAALDDWPAIWREAEPMRAALAEVMLTKSAAEWEDLLHGLGVPAERVRSLDEAVAMPHLRERGFFHRLDPMFDDGFPVAVPVAPFTFARAGPAIRSRPPAAGEHTDEILRSLGRSDAVIADLRGKGIVA